jgi:hypothetical protein
MRLAIALMLVVGCGTSTPSVDSFDCSNAPDAEPIAVGFTKTGDAGKIDFKLIDIQPAEPTSGDNNWTIQLFAAGTGDGVVGAEITASTIPDHTHPAGEPVAVAALATPGRFLIVPVLVHPGAWDTTIEVTGATSDTITFVACAPR